MPLFHLGLSRSGHDPALAIVDAAGTVVFAEAIERLLQDKPAWGISPDHVDHFAAALLEAEFDPQADTLEVATTCKKAKAEIPFRFPAPLSRQQPGFGCASCR